MLIVSVAVFFPTLVSAEYTDHFEDFEDFGFQVRTNATQNSSSTGLRFVYTIGALYYDKVGFVFSTSNQNPTVGGTGCASYRASTVYPSITTDGVAYPARSGRYWVAVELTGIPHAKFDKRIYVRPYLQYEGEYYYGDTDAVGGVEVAEALGEDVRRVFKTLVTVGKTKQHYVFMIPVAEELDLKKAAQAVGEKNIEMIPQKELLPLTGYVHGGCSPIGMKKQFTTVIDAAAENYDTILFSGGKIGYQVEVAPADLSKVIRFAFHDLTKLCPELKE